MEIYDWKTYDLDYTINSLTRWSIGGRNNNNPFILHAFIESIKAKSDFETEEFITNLF
jgi:hypothetical protein